DRHRVRSFGRDNEAQAGIVELDTGIAVRRIGGEGAEDALADGIGIDDAAGPLDAGLVELRARLPGKVMLTRDRGEPGGVVGNASTGRGGRRDRVARRRAGIAEDVADMDRVAGD